MTESEIILHSMAPCLLLSLVLRTPWQKLKAIQGYAPWLFAGASLPALAAFVQHVFAADRIAFLLRSPGLYAPAYALLVIGTLGFLVGCWRTPTDGWLRTRAMLLGYALHMGLLYFTSSGVALLYPWNEQYMSFALLPVGMPALNMWLLLIWLLVCCLPTTRRYLAPFGWGMAVLWIGLCVFQKGVVIRDIRAQLKLPVGQERVRLFTQPKDSLPWRWAVVVEHLDLNTVEIWEHAISRQQPLKLHQVAHWRNLTKLSSFLHTPVALRALTRLFQNPIGEAVIKNERWVVVLQEAASIHQVSPRRFTMEIQPAAYGTVTRHFSVQGFD